jgi:endonuclease/exonuclease/phosphatase family metal-dependent hydrolase
MTADATAWRMATFNIQYAAADHWRRKQDRLLSALRRFRADVLCLQEISAEGLSWVHTAMGGPPCFGVGRDDGVHAGEHVPIVLLNSTWTPVADGTFWFSETPERPSRAWGAAHPRICTWVRVTRPRAPDLTLFNVHLDHRSRRARAASGHLLRRYVEAKAADGRAVVCGDFNERRADRALAPFRSAQPPLVDVAIKAGDPTPTWRGIGPFGIGRARLDYVFADSRLAVRGYEIADHDIANRALSDHRPILVDFSG